MVYNSLILVNLCVGVKFYHLHAKINKKSVIFAQDYNEKIDEKIVTNRKYKLLN